MDNMWSPWHGCRKISEGCENCYMYYLDKIRDRDGAIIYKTKNFYMPIARKRTGEYVIKSGSTVSVCMSSDFFLEDADVWRDEAWQMIRERSDLKFFIITKRINNIADRLPADWEDGYENVIINATCENQKRTDERLPIFMNIPMKHRGIAVSPCIGEIHLSDYLASGAFELVSLGGENYEGARPCNYDWVKIIGNECRKYNVTFCFFETGTNFIKDGKRYYMPKKSLQSKMAYKSGMSYNGKKAVYKLMDPLGNSVYPDEYKPHFCENCHTCGMKIICSGCNNCGKCKNK